MGKLLWSFTRWRTRRAEWSRDLGFRSGLRLSAFGLWSLALAFIGSYLLQRSKAKGQKPKAKGQRPKAKEPKTKSLFLNHIPFRIVHRDVPKGSHLVFDFVPVADDYNRGVVGVEVLCGDALNIGGSQALYLRTKVSDEIFREIVGVDRSYAACKTRLACKLNREVSCAVFLSSVQLFICNRKHSHPIKFIEDLQQGWSRNFVADKSAGHK